MSTTDSQSLPRPSRARAIAIIVLCAMFLFFKYLMQVSPSVMTSQLMATFHLQGVGLGILGSAFFWSYLVTQLACGPLLDSFSIRWLSTAAIALGVGGLVLFSHTSTFSIAILARILMGGSAAFATVSYMKLTANWFEPKYFAMMSGFVATAAMIGAISGDAPLELITHHWGWQAAIETCAFIGVGLTICFALIVRDQPKELLPHNKVEAHPIRMEDIKKILKNPNNWILMFYTGLALSPVLVFAGLWGNPFLHHVYQIPKGTLAWYTSLSFAGMALGAPILGYISDKLNQRRLVMVGTAIIALIFLSDVIFFTDQPHWLLALSMFTFGFMSGSFMLGFAIATEINPIAVAATVVAVINTGDPIVGSWAEPLIGKILDHTWDHVRVNGAPVFTTHGYHVALSSLVIYLALTCVLVMCLKIKKTDEQ